MCSASLACVILHSSSQVSCHNPPAWRQRLLSPTAEENGIWPPPNSVQGWWGLPRPPSSSGIRLFPLLLQHDHKTGHLTLCRMRFVLSLHWAGDTLEINGAELLPIVCQRQPLWPMCSSVVQGQPQPDSAANCNKKSCTSETTTPGCSDEPKATLAFVLISLFLSSLDAVWTAGLPLPQGTPCSKAARQARWR